MNYETNEIRILDLAPTASLIIRDLLNLRPDEELLLIVDTESAMPMAYSLAFIASEIGAEYSISIMPSREKGFGRNPRLINVLPKAIEEGFKGADAIIGLTRGSFAPSCAPIQMDLIFKEKVARYISIAFRDLESFTRGGCLADYHQIRENCIKVKKEMESSKKIEIETTLGTKFWAEIPKTEDSPTFKGPYVRIETGWADKPGTECGFPDGETFFAPRQYSSNGILVIDGPIEYVGLPKTPIKVIIEKGIITKVEGEAYEAQRLKEILATMEDSEIIGEVAVGINDRSLINGNVQEEKKALGNVHIGFGVARRFKGTWLENLKKDIHSDIVIRKAIVKLDGKVIVKDNKLLI